MIREETISRIRTAADELRWEFVQLLQRAVRTPSVNPARAESEGEGQFQALIISELERLGAYLDVWEPDADIVEKYQYQQSLASVADYRRRSNVVGLFGTKERKVHLILNSHADTVAPHASAWRHDPFAAEIEDGWLYGLGSVDAKGCLIAYLCALSLLRHAGVHLRESVAFTSVVDEEVGGAGTLACIDRGYRADAALVGEPTSLTACPGTRGTFGISVTVKGQSVHAGVAYEGVNAIEKAILYVQAFHDLGLKLDAVSMHPLWAPLPRGHVFSVSSITTGTPRGGIPDTCEFRAGAGFMAGETHEEILAHIERAFAQVTQNDPWLRQHPPVLHVTPPFFEPSAADVPPALTQALMQAADDVGCVRPSFRAMSAASDARFLTNRSATPAVNFGPGDGRCAHSPDERISLDEFHQGIMRVALTVTRFCGVD